MEIQKINPAAMTSDEIRVFFKGSANTIPLLEKYNCPRNADGTWSMWAVLAFMAIQLKRGGRPNDSATTGE